MRRAATVALCGLQIILLGSCAAPLTAVRISTSKLLSATTHSGPVGSLDSCSALQIPKVALLFLTVGEVFHEATWSLWFQEAAGLIPTFTLKMHPNAMEMCDAERVQLAQQHCRPSQDAGVLESQHLFSVYVHALPEFEGFPEDSIFHGHLLQGRIAAKRCTHDIVLAEALQSKHAIGTIS